MMEGPSLLPSHLTFYEFCANDRELFQALIDKMDDLLLFFGSACEDERWVLQHSKFIRLILRWAAKQFYLGNLSLDDAHHLVKIIQNHYALLQPFLFFRSALFFTVKLRVENQDILVNSLLFGVGSPVLGRLLKRECFEKLNDEWILNEVKMLSFRLIETYLYKNQIDDLGKYARADLVDLMKLAQRWELHELVKDCSLFVK